MVDRIGQKNHEGWRSAQHEKAYDRFYINDRINEIRYLHSHGEPEEEVVDRAGFRQGLLHEVERWKEGVHNSAAELNSRELRFADRCITSYYQAALEIPAPEGQPSQDEINESIRAWGQEVNSLFLANATGVAPKFPPGMTTAPYCQLSVDISAIPSSDDDGALEF